MPVMLLYRLAAWRSLLLGGFGFRSASTKTWRSRPLSVSTSCSRTARAATSWALLTTNSVSERPVRSAACWNRAFCSSVIRASSLAVLEAMCVVSLMMLFGFLVHFHIVRHTAVRVKSLQPVSRYLHRGPGLREWCLFPSQPSKRMNREAPCVHHGSRCTRCVGDGRCGRYG